jgi:cysteine synthase A
MRFFGAKVILTPKADKAMGCYIKAVELADANGWFLARQFETDANAKIHANTTAREILADFAGDRLDYWVTGYGTGGTFSGVAKVLRQERPDTKIILSEPVNAQLLNSGVAQERDALGAPASSHPAFQPHLIQGWTPDFIPSVLQESVDAKRFDELAPVDGQEGIDAAKLLAQKEGIFTGISGGCTFAIALKIAQSAAPGTVILCMLPDTGERYLSSALFADVGEAMNDEEIALSASTPGFQLVDE